MQHAQAVWGEALGHQQVSHAYLLLTTANPTAVIQDFLIKLFCEKSCRECPKCSKILNQSHPDIKRIERDGKRIKIDQIRELQRDSRYPPLEAPYKIYILEGVEDLSLEAANSLLKILESPPSYVIFLLTAESANILPTILSRCQRLRLSPGSAHDLEKELHRRGLAAEQVSYALSLVAGLPERFERLLSLIDHLEAEDSLLAQRAAIQTRIESASPLETLEILAQAENLIEEREAALKLTQMLQCQRPHEVLEVAQAISKLAPAKSEFFLAEALRWHRDLLLAPDQRFSGWIYNSDQQKLLDKLAVGLDRAKISAAIRQLESGRELSLANANLQLFYESLLFRLAE